MDSPVLHHFVFLCATLQRGLESSLGTVIDCAAPNSTGSITDGHVCMGGGSLGEKGSNHAHPHYMCPSQSEKREGRRETIFWFGDQDANLVWGLVGKEESKWQSKSWNLCPNTPTTDRNSKRGSLYMVPPDLCSSHSAQPIQ